MKDWLYELAYQQLQTLDSNARIVVLHPASALGRALYARYLRDAHTCLVVLSGSGLTREALHTQVEAAYVQQGAPEDVTTWIIDECDRAQPQALSAYLADMLSRFGCARIMLSGWHSPTHLLESSELRALVRFVPVEPSLLLPDYAQRDTKRALLEVRALGGGHVSLNGREIIDWDGVLPRSLFFYLVDQGMVTRNAIFAAFWPSLSTRDATNVFHVTKRKISEVLGIDLTVYWSGYYRISPQIELSYDVAQFSELAQDSAIAAMPRAEALLNRAIRLYRNHFMMTLDSTLPWVQKRREELTNTYGDALISLAKLVEGRGHKQEALGLYLRAAAIFPHREDVAGSIMTLYHKQNMRDDALQVYDALEGELMSRLGISPAGWLQTLAAEIREGRKVAVLG
jgi:DNA-binding SARP family transcriptional activator